MRHRWRGSPTLAAILLVNAQIAHMSGQERPHVGVCICGMLSRTQPDSFAKNVLEANPDVDFSVVYVLQDARKPVYSTDYKLRIREPAPFAQYTHAEALSVLQRISPANAQVNLTDFVPTKDLDSWQATLRASAAEIQMVLTQYGDITDRILNMYGLQVRCGKELRALGKDFDAVILSREDAYLLDRLDLRPLLARIAEGACDHISKSCLSWGGVNMRFQMYSSEMGLEMLESRLRFFKRLMDKRERVHNPETFEMEQLEEAHATRCLVSVEELPVVVARHTHGGEFCIIHAEFETWQHISTQSVRGYDVYDTVQRESKEQGQVNGKGKGRGRGKGHKDKDKDKDKVKDKVKGKGKDGRLNSPNSTPVANQTSLQSFEASSPAAFACLCLAGTRRQQERGCYLRSPLYDFNSIYLIHRETQKLVASQHTSMMYKNVQRINLSGSRR
eukprot:scaffold8536_cov248-Pinguiococcus_pyrenoidosus.AAC.3